MTMKRYIILLLVSITTTGFLGCEQSDPEDVLGRIGDVVYFSGYEWDVKIYENTQQGPGPNWFSGHYEDVWVDEKGYLHMRISNRDGRWWASEIVGRDNIGFGTYTWVVQGDLENIPENIVLGLFSWDNNTFQEEANSEVDIEFAKWGDATTNKTLHYSVQPVSFGPVYPERSFAPETPAGSLIGVSTHSFLWTDSIIEWKSYTGEGIDPANQIAEWTFTLDNPARVKNENGLSSDPVIIPSPGATTNARINFWIMPWISPAPTDNSEHEIVIRSFTYTPL
ncbi:MAG: hypothetical protein ABR95_10540 [Sphingobacteriales bacterium BACL12 MAG-120813-bin55]|jgi:hypothetical protein|nr:MAG: hypothetical protein ABR94_13380 [Sphingobacteriales bacterium BACL12 MAG-120802-bin5]KRP13510.1 MAG: hypothetical protein ABR95_10540 [Sphingobacteriales bacterium BACL12 MAG-120813-bin55]